MNIEVLQTTTFDLTSATSQNLWQTEVNAGQVVVTGFVLRDVSGSSGSNDVEVVFTLCGISLIAVLNVQQNSNPGPAYRFAEVAGSALTLEENPTASAQISGSTGLGTCKIDILGYRVCPL